MPLCCSSRLRFHGCSSLLRGRPRLRFGFGATAVVSRASTTEDFREMCPISHPPCVRSTGASWRRQWPAKEPLDATIGCVPSARPKANPATPMWAELNFVRVARCQSSFTSAVVAPTMPHPIAYMRIVSLFSSLARSLAVSVRIASRSRLVATRKASNSDLISWRKGFELRSHTLLKGLILRSHFLAEGLELRSHFLAEGLELRSHFLAEGLELRSRALLELLHIRLCGQRNFTRSRAPVYG